MDSAASGAVDPKKACRELFNMYQESFNQMMENLKKCHGEAAPNEETTIAAQAVTETAGTNAGSSIVQEAEADEEAEKTEFMKKLEMPSALLNLPKEIADERLKQLCFTRDGPKIPRDVPRAADSNDRYQIPLINLCELQRLSLYAMRQELTAKAIKIKEDESLSGEEAGSIKTLISEYCNALRDFDYMREKDSDADRDPFYLTYARWCDWSVMKPKIASLYKGDPLYMLQVPRDTSDPEMVGDARGWAKKREDRRGFIMRLWFGLGGGLASIAPMLIVIQHRDRNTALVTASVGMLLFAMFMAYYHERDASPFALVGATAAYAAVLVVLVSTAL
ncbi:uncharacterized protein LY89DRAFT_784274 [Mollisia scopiformis]|uniref:Uncharacterized protein n=1 Tax=Mollisia scopiformis TaxID=149040 RepID=A0A194X284_MOLSC|nr:uncharacterized protein LY89DRAFT_784274 [Mollisia scopiformis]KUJ14306.1 hypothetical protein LY89DRAFT_784274 [Mollisia scopiformis]